MKTCTYIGLKAQKYRIFFNGNVLEYFEHYLYFWPTVCHVRRIVPAYIVRAYYNTWLVSNEKKEDDDMILN